MTLILAIKCSDGVVFAADSASTDRLAGIRQTMSTKIRRIRDFPIAFGGSGDVGLLQKIFERVSDAAKPKKYSDLTSYREDIKHRMTHFQKKAIQNYVPVPNNPHNPPIAHILLVGVTKEPWIFEVDVNGTDTLFDDDLGNFAAIGSGSTLAHAYFRPHMHTERNCKLGEIMAYRIVEDSINIAMMGLAHPINIHTIRTDGEYTVASSDDLMGLAGTCETWRELERETVGTMLTKHSPETRPTIPEPIEDDDT